MRKHLNLGTTLERFLDDDGTRAEVDAAALKHVVALQIEAEMRKRRMTKSVLAERMHTSRMAVDRLLDPTSGSVTLMTLGRVARALGRRLDIHLV